MCLCHIACVEDCACIQEPAYVEDWACICMCIKGPGAERRCTVYLCVLRTGSAFACVSTHAIQKGWACLPVSRAASVTH
jgi:hypothetical protein